MLDEKGKPVPLAHVYLINTEQESVRKTMMTDKNGSFYSKTEKDGKYQLFAMKKGFKPSPFLSYKPIGKEFYISLQEVETGSDKVIDYLKHFILGAIGLSFETLLITSLIFEVLLIDTFGIEKTLPYLSVSILNFSLWIMHLRHKHHHAEIQ